MEPKEVKDPNVNQDASQGPKGIRTLTQLTPEDLISATVPADKEEAVGEQVEEDITQLNPDPNSMESR